MADTKLSALTAITSIATTDELYVNDAGTSKKVTAANLGKSLPDATTSVSGNFSATDKTAHDANVTKLSGIATGATANDTDANLLDRTNHTGSQAQSTVTDLTTDLAAKADTTRTVVEKTVSGNVLSTDEGNIVSLNHASTAIVLTIPATGISVGTTVDVIRKGAAVCTITAAATVSLNGVATGSATIDAQYNAVTLVCISATDWVMVGAHGTVAT